MQPSTIPTLNQVSLIGTVYGEPEVAVVDRRRIVTFGLSMDGGGGRVHRVVVHDEFLAQSIHQQLKPGAVISVLGELDMDDDGSHVTVTSRRGSDLYLIMADDGGAPARSRPAAPSAQHPQPTHLQASPSAPQAQPAIAQRTPAPTPATQAPAAPPAQVQAAPPPAPTPASPAATPRPAAPTVPPSPRPGLPPQRPMPVAGARPAAPPPGPAATSSAPPAGRLSGLRALRSVPQSSGEPEEGDLGEDTVRSPVPPGAKPPSVTPIPGRSGQASPMPARTSGPALRPVNGARHDSGPPPLDPNDDEIPF